MITKSSNQNYSYNLNIFNPPRFQGAVSVLKPECPKLTQSARDILRGSKPQLDKLVENKEVNLTVLPYPVDSVKIVATSDLVPDCYTEVWNGKAGIVEGFIDSIEQIVKFAEDAISEYLGKK